MSPTENNNPDTQSEVSLSAPAEQTPENGAVHQAPTDIVDETATPAKALTDADADDDLPPEPDNTNYRANAVEELPCKEPLTEKQLAAFTLDQALAVLYTTPLAVEHSLYNAQGKELADPAGALDWARANTMSDETSQMTEGNAGMEAWRENAEWRQYIEHGGQRYRTQKPKIGEATGRILSGTAAIRRVQARLSMGAHMRQPMWNSGFWVTIVPPQESTLLNLDRRLQMEKIRLGRQTRGAVFDNYRVYVLAELVNTILEHVDDSSLQPVNNDLVGTIKNNLLVTDIPALALAFACTIYPDGYNLAQPCSADVSKCQHVARELISLTKLLWVDRTRFTEDQRRHMARKASDKVTVDEVLKYQQGFPAQTSGIVDLPGNMRLCLKVPTFTEYEDSGTRWVTNIESDLDRAFRTQLTGVERDEFMLTQANAQVLRNYSHWFAEIILDVGEDHEQVIQDPQTLEETARMLSPDENIVDLIEAAVGKYQTDITVTVIGLVNYACPKCGQYQLRADAPNKVIIPMDAVSTFFTLQYNRLMKRVL